MRGLPKIGGGAARRARATESRLLLIVAGVCVAHADWRTVNQRAVTPWSGATGVADSVPEGIRSQVRAYDIGLPGDYRPQAGTSLGAGPG